MIRTLFRLVGRCPLRGPGLAEIGENAIKATDFEPYRCAARKMHNDRTLRLIAIVEGYRQERQKLRPVRAVDPAVPHLPHGVESQTGMGAFGLGAFLFPTEPVDDHHERFFVR